MSVQVSYFNFDAEFTEPANRVADVEIECRPPKAILCRWVPIGIDPRRSIACTNLWREKPLRGLAKSPVELHANPVGISKLKVRAQFRTEACDVDKGQSSCLRKGYVVRLRPVDLCPELENRRGVTLFVDSDQQADFAVILCQTVGNALEEAHSGQTG